MSEQYYNDINKAFNTNNLTKLKELHNTKPIPQMHCHMFIDTALIDGNENMAKFLATEGKCRPSLYAKQYAHINKHHKLNFWMDDYAEGVRNNTSIKDIHYNHKKQEWASHIPEEFRY